ncbi:hypothetical protein BABINDRAFT_163549 [Babjeviella inositovora NRRL Y-12698]|uniref:Uncharacterized protein n=1 Tax=Babjeviella inositovora NRRL Y-12698 TaxID=984486 RepID=A0A1E3QIL4_9ASCO|nr:uncharacterized protein BABINDRAFT_163549 [Babjeviella inositovora NRRL Y-12698]ODQ77553.1 hypothetical protein BABINDRAFT_163549 [Babjeviella inositovora NRRL Y-12698]
MGRENSLCELKWHGSADRRAPLSNVLHDTPRSAFARFENSAIETTRPTPFLIGSPNTQS